MPSLIMCPFRLLGYIFVMVILLIIACLSGHDSDSGAVAPTRASTLCDSCTCRTRTSGEISILECTDATITVDIDAAPLIAISITGDDREEGTFAVRVAGLLKSTVNRVLG